MPSFVDQISTLLASAQNNYIKNNELFSDLPNVQLFSNLLSQYVGDGDDANIAALSGNFVPLLGPDVATQAQPVPPTNFSIPSALEGDKASLVSTTLQQPAGLQLISANSQERTTTPILHTAPNNIGTQNSESQLEGVSPQNILLKNTTDNVPIGEVKDSIPRANTADVLLASHELQKSSLTPTINADIAQKANVSSQAPGLERPEYNLQNQRLDVAQTILRQGAQTSANPILQNQNIYTGLESAYPNIDKASTNIAVTNIDAKQHRDILQNNGVIPPQQVATNQENAVQKLVINPAENGLESRERASLPLASTNLDINKEGQNTSEKPPQSTVNHLLVRTNESAKDLQSYERFALNVNSLVSERDVVQAKPLENIATIDVRKESVLTSTSIREFREQHRRAESRTNIDYEADASYRPSRVAERSIVKHDFASAYQNYSNVENPPTLKFVEINIDQKTPVTINIAADTNVFLKPLSTDAQILPARELSPSELTSSALKTGEIRNGNDIAEQIAWAQRNNTQQVRISISPEHLGAIDISIDDAADGLNIQFMTQNAQAKDALELFMPRLKEMLEQSGFNLQNANVSQQGEGKSNFNLSEQATEDFSQKQAEDDSYHVKNGLEDTQETNSSNQLLDAFA